MGWLAVVKVWELHVQRRILNGGVGTSLFIFTFNEGNGRKNIRDCLIPNTSSGKWKLVLILCVCHLSFPNACGCGWVSVSDFFNYQRVNCTFQLCSLEPSQRQARPDQARPPSMSFITPPLLILVVYQLSFG